MKTNLLEEMAELRRELRKRRQEATAASHVLRECKGAVIKAEADLDRLLDEIESGEVQLPLFERIQVSDGKTPNQPIKTSRRKPAAEATA